MPIAIAQNFKKLANLKTPVRASTHVCGELFSPSDIAVERIENKPQIREVELQVIRGTAGFRIRKKRVHMLQSYTTD